jgi:Phage capsid protein
MSDTVTQAFVQQFDSAIRMLSAQMQTRFLSAVTSRGTINGESFTINNLDPSGDMPADTVRHGDTVFSDITHSTRVATMRDFFDALPLDRADIPKMAANPVTGGHYAQTLVGKRNRKIDNLIYRACRDSQLMKDGTSTALPAGQKIAHGSTGMTKAKIIQARKIFRANEKDMHTGEELYFAYTADMLEDILGDTTLTSSDFLAVQMLQDGDVSRKWMGFNWVPFEGIDPVSSSTYYTVAWAKSAIHFGEGFVEGRVDRRPDKKNLFQTSLACSMAAGRQDEKGVVEIAYQ